MNIDNCTERRGERIEIYIRQNATRPHDMIVFPEVCYVGSPVDEAII